MTTTLKHELGHTLGLGHDDEPARIMSNDPEDRIPDYHERRTILEAYNDSVTPYNRGATAWSNTLDAWNDGDFRLTEHYAVQASDAFADALSLIDDARTTASSIRAHDVAALLSESFQHANYRRMAAEAAADMAQAAQAGRNPEPYRRSANEYNSEARNIQFHSSRVVATELGLG